MGMAKKKKEKQKTEKLTEQQESQVDSTDNDGQTSENGEQRNTAQRDEVAEMKDKYLRLFAEFDNYKKRTAKERLELIRTASEDVLSSLLPVLDDFQRAKKAADDEKSDEVFSEGVTLVYNKLHNILETKGLKQMEIENHAFDPELHEAITKIPAPSVEMKGKIIDVIEPGYLLHDKIIRYAKVVIGE